MDCKMTEQAELAYVNKKYRRLKDSHTNLQLKYEKINEDKIVEVLKKHESTWVSYDDGVSCVYNINYPFVAREIIALLKNVES